MSQMQLQGHAKLLAPLISLSNVDKRRDNSDLGKHVAEMSIPS